MQEALRHELELKDSVFWTDSKVALFWIKNEAGEWKQFVQNRVIEIRNLVSPNSWQHCPRKDNPADIPSRGINPSDLAGSMLWHSGPDWLSQTHTEEFGDADEHCVPPEECLAEMKVTKPSNLLTLTPSDSSHGLNEIIRCERFGTLQRLLRVTAYVLRFVKAAKRRKDGRIEGEV